LTLGSIRVISGLKVLLNEYLTAPDLENEGRVLVREIILTHSHINTVTLPT
jgi:hypothetical protein